MAIAVSMQASSFACAAQRRASCLIEGIDTDVLPEHTRCFEIGNNRCRETLGFFLCALRTADGVEPAIGKADVLGLEPGAVQSLVLDHVAKLVKNWIVFGENERIAELRTEGVPLNRNRITNIFVAHE